MLKNKYIESATRIVSFFFVLSGILATCGFFKGHWDWSLFMYYTVQSNTLILFMFGYLSVATLKSINSEGKTGIIQQGIHFEMICMIDIFLTFFVYWTMLAPKMTSIWKFDNVAVHGITPLLCVADYILYHPKKRLIYKDVYLALVYPLLYVSVNTLVGFMGYRYSYDNLGRPVRFPYFFMDYDRIGSRALIYIAALTIFLLIIAHIVYIIDRKK